MQSHSDMKILHPSNIGEPLEHGDLGELGGIPAMLVLPTGHVRYVTIHSRTMMHDGEGKYFYVTHGEDEGEWRQKWGMTLFNNAKFVVG